MGFILGIPPQHTGDMTQLKYRAPHTRIIAYGYDLTLQLYCLLFCSIRLDYIPYATLCMLHTFMQQSDMENNMADLPNVHHEQIDEFKRIAGSANDTSVLMLNLNRYTADASYPDGALYKEYMAVLSTLLEEVGGKVLWRTHVHGCVVGEQSINEALGIWYPTHQAFLDLMTAPSSKKNMELRSLAVEHADLHRCNDYSA